MEAVTRWGSPRHWKGQICLKASKCNVKNTLWAVPITLKGYILPRLRCNYSCPSVSLTVEPRIWRADCIHCTMPFDATRDLSICGFSYLRGSWNQSPIDIEGQLYWVLKWKGRQNGLKSTREELRKPYYGQNERWRLLSFGPGMVCPVPRAESDVEPQMTLGASPHHQVSHA